MITLVRDGIYMEVSTDQLASLFERNGYVRVEAAKIVEPGSVVEEKTDAVPGPSKEAADEPKRPRQRRSRKKTAESEQSQSAIAE